MWLKQRGKRHKEQGQSQKALTAVLRRQQLILRAMERPRRVLSRGTTCSSLCFLKAHCGCRVEHTQEKGPGKRRESAWKVIP